MQCDKLEDRIQKILVCSLVCIRILFFRHLTFNGQAPYERHRLPHFNGVMHTTAQASKCPSVTNALSGTPPQTVCTVTLFGMLGLLHMHPLQLWLKACIHAWSPHLSSTCVLVTCKCLEALAFWRSTAFFDSSLVRWSPGVAHLCLDRHGEKVPDDLPGTVWCSKQVTFFLSVSTRRSVTSMFSFAWTTWLLWRYHKSTRWFPFSPSSHTHL